MGKKIPVEERPARADLAPGKIEPERELYQIFLRTREGKPRYGLLLISVAIHIVIFAVILPAVPINIKPRLAPKVIQVRTWTPPLAAPPQPRSRTRPRARAQGLIGKRQALPDPSALGSEPIDEPSPEPDPNLFLLDPDAIYRLEREEQRSPSRKDTAPRNPEALGAPVLGVLESPPIEGLLVAGFGGVSTPVLIESSRVQPRYPPAARQARIEGKVVLQAVIFKDGSVGDIQVLQTPGEKLGFDEAAIAAVSQWKYRPALQSGRPVDVVSVVIVEFRFR